MKRAFLAIVLALALTTHAAHGQQVDRPGVAETIDRGALEADKLQAEVAKLRAEVDHLTSVGNVLTTWLAALGTVIGGLIAGLITWKVARMGHRLAASQNERTEREAALSVRRLIQEREIEREQHNFRLFEALRNESLAAAAVLLDRLRHLQERFRSDPSKAREIGPADPNDDERLLVKKVLLNVLKMDTIGTPPSAEGEAAVDDPSRGLAAPSYLRKYIAEEMVDILGVKSPLNRRPTEAGTSPLGERREFQRCDLRDVYWANVDARGLDFYGCDLSGASLREAALRGSVFYEALMAGVVLQDADLRGANLMGADLRNGNLAGTRLQGANLTNANLDGVSLDGAVYNTEPVEQLEPTQWPSPGFDPKALGARIDNGT